jgi:hypothetical protein
MSGLFIFIFKYIDPNLALNPSSELLTNSTNFFLENIIASVIKCARMRNAPNVQGIELIVFPKVFH